LLIKGYHSARYGQNKISYANNPTSHPTKIPFVKGKSKSHTSTFSFFYQDLMFFIADVSLAPAINQKNGPRYREPLKISSSNIVL
jgi:hypothetical protein